MAEFVVSASMGAMNPLLAKLTTLMGDEYKKLKGLRQEVSFLTCELSAMKALLEKMGDVDELDPQVKDWRRDIIDMSYDIEDYTDDFVQHAGKANEKVGILQKASHNLRTIKDRYRIANRIQEIKTRVLQASERRLRYKIDDRISIPTSVSIDPRLSAFYKESTNLVGIDRQKQDLVKWVMDEAQQLKVLSIVGFGGLGKTTLANEVYREVRGQFNCNIFVSISQKPDMTRLLTSIISDDLKLPLSSNGREVKDLINVLRGYLQDKRYFIAVDDLWDVRAWNIISCAFPQNKEKSRVIVTTRIEDVAKSCCSDHGCVHVMKPLGDSDSKKLFFNRIFGSEAACPPQFMNVSCEILKKCGGLPLAIITVASILACQPTRIKEQWEYIKSCLAPHSATNPSLEDMMHILDLSYKNLPQHLKACFLYLGFYPEDREISRSELVRRWVAEGFVSNSHGQDAWEVASSYFNELINRSMIQPVYDNYNFRVICCRVHDMMLDLITKRCGEDNFITVVRDPHGLAEVQHKVRRLSVDLSVTADDDTTIPATTIGYLSQVRSLAIHGASKWMPPLSERKFLRVLLLEFPKFVARIELTGIIQLPQLRYLKVECKAWLKDGPALVIVLPSQIRRMRHLQTLELPNASVCAIPPDMVDLPSLSHLTLPAGTRLPDGIGKLKTLRTLDGYSLLSNSSENTKALGELTNLASLVLSCRKVYWEIKQRRCTGDDTPEAMWKPALSSCLEKLGALKHLYMISIFETCDGDALSSICPPFHSLEHLELLGLNFSRVPRWIGDLHNLKWLRIGLVLKETSSWEEDVGIIGRLPSLGLLWLRMPITLTENIVIGGSTGFRVLEQFFISGCDCGGMRYVAFEAGAMPRLWKLSLDIVNPGECDKDKATPDGLQHLPSLREIHVSEANPVWPEDIKDNTRAMELIKGVFQDAADVLPTRPSIITSVNTVRPKEKDT